MGNPIKGHNGPGSTQQSGNNSPHAVDQTNLVDLSPDVTIANQHSPNGLIQRKGPDALGVVAEKLVRSRLLRPVERSDTAERAYELAHEYLIAEIALSPEAVARKEAEELLRQGVDTWHRFGALLSA